MNAELFLIPNPDPSAPAGFLEVPIAGEQRSHRSVIYAELIRRAVNSAGLEDPQARVMESLYLGTGVPRHLTDHLEPTLLAQEVASPLRQALCDIDEAQPDSVPVSLTLLGTVLDSPLRDYISRLTPEGLFAAVPSGDHSRPAVEALGEIPGLGDDEIEIATELELTAYGVETELVWKQEPSHGLMPMLLSNRQHTALGHVSAEGVFEHVVTVLGRDHPIRSSLELSEHHVPD